MGCGVTGSGCGWRVLACAGLFAQAVLGASPWLDKVGPILTDQERRTYSALPAQDREAFESAFWENRPVTAEEYFRRLDHVDAMWGAGRTGSGANTDPGRVYLALGGPTKVTRVPSSRTFVPLEVWYYDTVPGVVSTELRLLFFRPNGMGLPKLYSPETDSLRALLVPQAATIQAFGPNESLTESDIRKVLKVPVAEDEVVTAAVAVAPGIKGSGNQEILGFVMSPRKMLVRGGLREKVTARLVVAKARMESAMTASEFGGMQVDLRFQALSPQGAAQKEVGLEVLADGVTVAQNRVRLGLGGSKTVEYSHRLDLLPGRYRLLFTSDGAASDFVLDVPERAGLGAILRADTASGGSERSPFSFGGQRYDLDAEGRYALVPAASGIRVLWMVRHGSQVVWRGSSEGASGVAVIELPTNLAPGEYRLEASTTTESQSAAFVVRGKADAQRPVRAAISYNANLAPALRYAAVGRQFLLRGRKPEARKALEQSLRAGQTADAAVMLARLDALDGNLDAARDRVRAVLAVDPAHFEALSVYAFVEAGFQDYAVAAQLYRRALEVQDSAAVRAALASLPVGR
jgi:GWxTD domain-containing protein